MTLPVVSQPNAVSDDDGAKRLILQAMSVLHETRKPGLADIDEYWDFNAAAGTAERSFRKAFSGPRANRTSR